MTSDLFVTGTDTNVGKTLLSALLVASLDRRYWKPIQTGTKEGTDREAVMKWAGVSADRTHPEAYRFEHPVAPQFAAELSGVTIDLARIQRPVTDEPLIIEGAGGVLAPISDDALMLDLMERLGTPVVIASRTALGTINHTLLTITLLRETRLEVRGVVMIGKDNPDNRRAIEGHGKVPVIGSIPPLEALDRSTLRSVFDRHFDARAFE